MKNQLKQIIYDMRTQPVIAWVTILGTAMSIFLILVMLTIQLLYIMPFAPENHRARMLYGKYFHFESTAEGNHSSGSGGLSLLRARQLYKDLEGVEDVSFMQSDPERMDAKGPVGETFSVYNRATDDAFWRIYDFDLLEGRYYTPEEIEAGTPVAVVSESTARRLFGSEPAVGGRMQLNHNYYDVIGVVGDVSRLGTWSFGDVYTPIDATIEENGSVWDVNMGDISAAMLVREGVDFESIRDRVKARYALIDTELASENRRTLYHGAPFDQETITSGLQGSNSTPDLSDKHKMDALIYIILLLVPAINLSSMLHSRLRRRISDIGVRRAFGCTRRRIIRDIIVENFLITLAGGLIGLVAGVLFSMFWDGMYTTEYNESIHPTLSMLLNWRIILGAFGACFVLNIISASMPAWQAARVNPVTAINASK
ncbi:MAG: ABC transporter permease [Muribaculaceae bacterium]|nr:ABC transporter permease [Muribaculaceae bacterium]